MEICNKLEDSENEALSSILSITREVMELTITEEDFDRMTSEDIPAISRIFFYYSFIHLLEIIYNHCSDEITQSSFMLLLRNIVSLPSEGKYGHDLWRSLVEMSENLVSVSTQMGSRTLGFSVKSIHHSLPIVEEEEVGEGAYRRTQDNNRRIQ